jgi:hypothetical protein
MEHFRVSVGRYVRGLGSMILSDSKNIHSFYVPLLVKEPFRVIPVQRLRLIFTFSFLRHTTYRTVLHSPTSPLSLHPTCTELREYILLVQSLTWDIGKREPSCSCFSHMQIE